MAWIKFEKDLLTDPRMLRMARRLCERGLRCPFGPVTQERNNERDIRYAGTLLAGAWCALWVYADTHIRSEDELQMGTLDIDQLVGIEGFCELAPPDWIEVVDADSLVRLPNYQEHNGVEQRRRDQAALRMQRHRERQRNTVQRSSVTRSSPDLDLDKTREDQKVKSKSNVGPKPDASPLEKPKGNGHALHAEAETVLAYLNRATGRSFQFRNPKGELTPNANVIIARLKEEYTGEQLREVVMLKAEQWRGDAKMGEFLRPETLFGKTKFATYVGELSAASA